MQEYTGVMTRKGFLNYMPSDNNKLSYAIAQAIEPTIQFARSHAQITRNMTLAAYVDTILQLHCESDEEKDDFID